MPFEDYAGDVFYAANLGDNHKVPYFRNNFEHNGTNYTFWVIEGMDEEEADIRIKQYFRK
ncbi:hypothetical protein OHV92_18685 [Acinetobacter baumannii]|nr:hypothetical protein [Acinetobacter baumannii]